VCRFDDCSKGAYYWFSITCIATVLEIRMDGRLQIRECTLPVIFLMQEFWINRALLPSWKRIVIDDASSRAQTPQTAGIESGLDTLVFLTDY